MNTLQFLRALGFFSLLFLFNGTHATNRAHAAPPFEFGFGRSDITPREPLRLSGYGSRTEPFEGVDTPLRVRAMAMRSGEKQHLAVLVSVDTIGFPAELTDRIAKMVKDKHDVPNSRFVLCSTHSHTAPHLAGGLQNLFAQPPTEQQQQDLNDYTDHVHKQVLAAVDNAVQDLAPGRMFVGQGTATFAENRRVLKDGTWTGFGVNPAGPVDHSLPVLRITDATGETTRGLLFNYACHCTTFGGEYNRVNGDWAGYAAAFLETSFEGATALCTIGCGADANPQRDPANALTIAQAQGEQIADEVRRLVETDMKEVTAELKGSFGWAGLPIDRPTDAELQEALKSTRPQVRRHAEVMIDTKKRMGRLPETFPMPIEVWRFGDEFCMVFLGGEVVVDYALRIKQELAKELPGLSEDRIWVTAYANDVFGYVASERMQSEGGYEVDFSQIYYLQPGRWSSGTEDVVLRRVHELFHANTPPSLASIDAALDRFTLPEGFAIEAIAGEPLVQDPINMAIDARGRLWVVEMGDYPRGAPPDQFIVSQSDNNNQPKTPWDGPPGGRVKVLQDTDGDGDFNEATVFLDGLSFPMGVFPWRDGVVIAAAPDILFARDTDGDGRCDERTVLYTGFAEANPQHRINGFEYGLDGWLYLASGTNNGTVTCVKTGEQVEVGHRDIRIHPQTGRLQTVGGDSQYIRTRDDFGHWFGNTNTEPLFQLVMADEDLRRNPFVPSPSPIVFLTNPPRSPVVYPTSRTLDRFNDLHTLNRFTSACAPHIYRDDTLGEPMSGAALICEPVHNLISRRQLIPDGLTFTTQRFQEDEQSEFLSSTDNWFRPVRVLTAPDGSLLVCDMYRQVIEHPEWIPEAWQARLDLYAGHDYGRIYRIHRSADDQSPRQPFPNLHDMTGDQLVEQLHSPNGWRRDTAQRLLTEKGWVPQVESQLRRLIVSHDARTAVTAVWTLANNGLDPRESVDADHSETITLQTQAALIASTAHMEPRSAGKSNDPTLLFQQALAVGSRDDAPTERLIHAAIEHHDDPWMRAAILSSSVGRAEEVLAALLRQTDDSPGRTELINGLIATALANDPAQGFSNVIEAIQTEDKETAVWQLAALHHTLAALERKNLSLAELATRDDAKLSKAVEVADSLIDRARKLAAASDVAAKRQAVAVTLLGHGVDGQAEDVANLGKLLRPQVAAEVQAAAAETLAGLNEFEPLIERYNSLSPALRSTVQQAMLTRDDTAEQLLAAIADDDIPANSLDAASRQAFAQHRIKEVRRLAAQILGESHTDRADLIRLFADSLDLKPDIARGKVLFEKRCATCHKHGDIGKEFGSKLSALANKPGEFFLTAILDPNRAVESKYIGYTILTADGRSHNGLIVEDGATSLTLARTDGKTETILRREIEELLATGKSFMPEGLEKDLSTQDLADIIGFVRSER